jgi:hypothetical protein
MFAYQNAPIDHSILGCDVSVDQETHRKRTSTVWMSVTSKHEDAKANRASDTFCGHCLQAAE